jgi:hypothetical protein
LKTRLWQAAVQSDQVIVPANPLIFKVFGNSETSPRILCLWKRRISMRPAGC